MLKKTFAVVAIPFLAIGVLLLIVSLFLPGIAFVIGLVISLLVLGLGVVLIVIAAVAKDRPSQKILSSGQQAPATVLEFQAQGGDTLAANPPVHFVLGVDGPMGPRQVEVTQATPQAYLRRIQQGSVLPVCFEAARPDVVLIDWAHASAVLDGTVPPMDLQ